MKRFVNWIIDKIKHNVVATMTIVFCLALFINDLPATPILEDGSKILDCYLTALLARGLYKLYKFAHSDDK